MSTNEKPNAGASGQKAPWTVKRIAAVAGIVLLVAMYVVTLHQRAHRYGRRGKAVSLQPWDDDRRADLSVDLYLVRRKAHGSGQHGEP